MTTQLYTCTASLQRTRQRLVHVPLRLYRPCPAGRRDDDGYVSRRASQQHNYNEDGRSHRRQEGRDPRDSRDASRQRHGRRRADAAEFDYDAQPPSRGRRDSGYDEVAAGP